MQPWKSYLKYEPGYSHSNIAIFIPQGRFQDLIKQLVQCPGVLLFNQGFLLSLVLSLHQDSSVFLSSMTTDGLSALPSLWLDLSQPSGPTLTAASLSLVTSRPLRESDARP